jgi:hypothetical protein
VVGAFPDGQSALSLAAAWLRHIASTAWSTKRSLNIGLPKDQQMRGVYHHLSQRRTPLSPNQMCEKFGTLPRLHHPRETRRWRIDARHPDGRWFGLNCKQVKRDSALGPLTD